MMVKGSLFLNNTFRVDQINRDVNDGASVGGVTMDGQGFIEIEEI